MRSIRAFVRPLLRHFLLPAATAALVLSGVAGGERTASAQVVAVAPPAPRIEVVTAAPSPNHFWIPGYWGYQPGYGHRWYGGRWEAPRAGYSWSQPGWAGGARGWEFRHGGWARGGGGVYGRGGYGGGGVYGRGGGYGGGGGWHGANASHGGFHGGHR
jgi:hypothetical protein